MREEKITNIDQIEKNRKLVEKAQVNFEQENWEEVIQYLNPVLNEEPYFTNGYIYRGSAYSSLYKNQEAIKDFSEALKRNPDMLDAYFNRGSDYKRLGNLEKAKADFEEMLNRMKTPKEVYKDLVERYFEMAVYRLGIICYELGEYMQSKAYFEKVESSAQEFEESKVWIRKIKNITQFPKNKEPLKRFNIEYCYEDDFLFINANRKGLEELEKFLKPIISIDKHEQCYIFKSVWINPQEFIYDEGVLLDELVFYLKSSVKSEKDTLLSVKIDISTNKVHINMNKKGLKEFLEIIAQQKTVCMDFYFKKLEEIRDSDDTWGCLSKEENSEFDTQDINIIRMTGGMFDRKPYLNLEYLNEGDKTVFFKGNSKGLEQFYRQLLNFGEGEKSWEEFIHSGLNDTNQTGLSPMYYKKNKETKDEEIVYKTNNEGAIVTWFKHHQLKKYAFHKINDESKEIISPELDFKDSCLHFYLNTMGLCTLARVVRNQIEANSEDYWVLEDETDVPECERLSSQKYGPKNLVKLKALSICGGEYIA